MIFILVLVSLLQLAKGCHRTLDGGLGDRLKNDRYILLTKSHSSEMYQLLIWKILLYTAFI